MCQHRPETVTNPSHFLWGKQGGILREKIPSKQLWNAKEQLCVDAVIVENAVTGAAVEVQLLGEPRHRTPLHTQLFLDNMPNMDEFCHGVLRCFRNTTEQIVHCLFF